jgi:hypothetical protein
MIYVIHVWNGLWCVRWNGGNRSDNLPANFVSQRFERQMARRRATLLPLLQRAPRDLKFQRSL